MQIPQLAQNRWPGRGAPMRPTPAGVEVARALIARVKAADSSINRRDELWYASDSDALDRRDWHVRRFAPAEWAGDRVGRSAREAGASLHGRSSPGRRAESGTRVAAKRVAVVLDVGARPGVFAQVATGMDSKPPTTLRGGSACRAMLANNRRRPPLLPGRGALNLGVSPQPPPLPSPWPPPPSPPSPSLWHHREVKRRYRPCLP